MEREKLVKLVTDAQNGDKKAMNLLFNEFYNDVYYFALKTVKSEDIACDITQETFVDIIKSINDLKEPAAFVTWMKQVTYHQCTRYFKKKKDVLVESDEDETNIFDTLTEDHEEFIPDEALEQKAFKETILAIIDELSEEQRSAVMMYYFDEMSVSDIAHVQGVSEGTVKSRLNYARKAIKKSVEDYEEKNGVKLHALPFFPLFKWLFGKENKAKLPIKAAKTMSKSITSSTGTSVYILASTGAKIAAIPVFVKVAAVVVSVAVAGVGAVSLLSDNKTDEPKTDETTVEAVQSDDAVDNTTDDDVNMNEEEKIECLKFLATEYTKYENHDGYLPVFEDTSKLSDRDALLFVYWRNLYGDYEVSDIDESNAEMFVPAEDFGVWSQKTFGKSFDINILNGVSSAYNMENHIFTYNEEKMGFDVAITRGNEGDIDEGAECTVENTGDNTYIVTVTRKSEDTQRVNTISFTYMDNYWRINSNISINSEIEKETETNTPSTPEDDLTEAEKIAEVKNMASRGTLLQIDGFLPEFENTSNLSARDAGVYIYSQHLKWQYESKELDNGYCEEFIPIKDFELWSQRRFGKVYDFTALDGAVAEFLVTEHTFRYDAKKKGIVATYPMGGGGDALDDPKSCTVKSVGDNTYVATVTYVSGNKQRVNKVSYTYVDGYWRINSNIPTITLLVPEVTRTEKEINDYAASMARRISDYKYFNYTYELSAENVADYLYNENYINVDMDDRIYYDDPQALEAWYTYIPVSEFEIWSYTLFGRNYDFRSIKDFVINEWVPFYKMVLTYDESKDAMKLTYLHTGNGGGDDIPENEIKTTVSKLSDDKYDVLLTLYDGTTEYVVMTYVDGYFVYESYRQLS